MNECINSMHLISFYKQKNDDWVPRTCSVVQCNIHVRNTYSICYYTTSTTSKNHIASSSPYGRKLRQFSGLKLGQTQRKRRRCPNFCILSCPRTKNLDLPYVLSNGGVVSLSGEYEYEYDNQIKSSHALVQNEIVSGG